MRIRWNTDIFTFFVHSKRFIHITAPQTSLSPIFQSCFFQFSTIQLNHHWSWSMNMQICGIWATFSCKFLRPSEYSQAQSFIYHFLLVIECCQTWQNLWLHGIDNTKFMMGSSCCIATWWPLVNYSVSTKTQQKTKSCLLKLKQLSTEEGRVLI